MRYLPAVMTFVVIFAILGVAAVFAIRARRQARIHITRAIASIGGRVTSIDFNHGIDGLIEPRGRIHPRAPEPIEVPTRDVLDGAEEIRGLRMLE